MNVCAVEAQSPYFGLIAIALGAVTPVVTCCRLTPELLSSLTLLLPEFATHISPVASKARASGPLKPTGENGEPLNTPPLLVNTESEDAP